MTARSNVIIGPWPGSNVIPLRPFEGLPDLAQIERWRKEAKLPERFAEDAKSEDLTPCA